MIKDLFKQKKPVVSFEVFPPKQDADIESIYQTLAQLKPLKPDFISVTYSAGGIGGTQITFEVASAIKNKYGIEPLAHLTCIQASPEEIDQYLNKLRNDGVLNIMALRGDFPPDGPKPMPHYNYAKELIAQIKANHQDFCIGGAAYPEGHINAESMAESLTHMQQKVEAGADFLITQLFFDNREFNTFKEKALKMGITTPVSAGIMPILGLGQIQKMIFMCGVSLPSQIIRILNKYEHSPEDLLKAGLEYSSLQIRDLIGAGVDGIHIYTMNRPQIAEDILSNIKDLLA